MTDFVPFPDPDLEHQFLSGDDFASGGTVKVVVTGSVDGQTLVKEATKDIDAVVPGFAIGNVTVTGDASPEINTATTYTATFDGGNDADLFNVTYNWSVIGLQGSTLTSIGNTAQIEFESDAVSYTVRCTVDADNASDGPVSGDLVVTPVSSGSQTSIGTVTIAGSTLPFANTEQFYEANITGGDATNLSYSWNVTSLSSYDILAEIPPVPERLKISFDDAGASYVIDVDVTSGDANWDGVTQSDDITVNTPTPPPPTETMLFEATGNMQTSGNFGTGLNSSNTGGSLTVTTNDYTAPSLVGIRVNPPNADGIVIGWNGNSNAAAVSTDWMTAEDVYCRFTWTSGPKSGQSATTSKSWKEIVDGGFTGLVPNTDRTWWDSENSTWDDWSQISVSSAGSDLYTNFYGAAFHIEVFRTS